MKKRTISMLLIMALVIGMLPMGILPARAYSETDIAYPVEGGNIYFDKETGTITDCDETTTIANIPSEIDGVTVTSIGNRAFYYCESLVSVTIPDGVMSIGDKAFYYCKSLVSVTIPDSMTSIGDSAFQYCKSLISVTIPDGVTSIDFNLFHECASLTSVIIPNSVTSIGSSAFYKCTSLTSVTIPNSVTSIDDSAFSWCSSLTGIWVDEANERYSSDEYGVLFNKDKTTLIQCPSGYSGSYTVPDGVTSIGDSAFHYCDSLTGIFADESNEHYSSDEYGVLFSKDGTHLIKCPSGCGESYAIPDGVTRIGKSAFYYCTSLTGITIPDSVMSIGEDAFSYTGYYNNEENWTKDCLYIGKHLIEAGNLYSLPESYSVREGTLTIADYAFVNELYLTNVTIPDSVRTIGDSAFENIRNLESVTLGNGVTCIGNKAFLECVRLKAITIPDSVKSIGGRAFQNCDSLTSIAIPDSVTSIGYAAFWSCDSLESVKIGNGVTSVDEDLFWNCGSLSSVVLGCGVTSFDRSAFNYCDKITEIWVDAANEHYSSDENGVLLNKDKTILVWCPSGYSGDYVIPYGVVTIGNSAFAGCSGLTSVTIPDSVEMLGESAFLGCSGLNSVTIGDGVTSLSNHAFNDCSNLTNIEFGNNLIHIGYCAFSGCGFTGVTLPEGVTHIGNHAFWRCVNLANVSLPDSLRVIDAGAFEWCYSLNDIDIPQGVNRIGGGAFYDTAYYNDKSNWQNGVLYLDQWLIDAEEELSGQYEILAGTVGIADEAFLWCGLTSVAIPSSVISVGECAFETSSLTGIWVDAGNEYFSNDECGFLFNKDKTALIRCPGDYSGSYVIPKGVASVGFRAFALCDGLTAVTFPDSVTNIGTSAFYCCYNLTGAYFKGDAPVLGDFAFCVYTYGGSYPNEDLTLYYVEGKEGWTSPTWNGYNTATWEPPHEHEYTAVVTEATCTEQGYTTHICPCGDSYVADYVNALGHDYGQWSVVKEASCTEEGEEIGVCSRCDSTESRKIAATGHSYEAVTTAPTCTEQGYTTYTCACGESYVADYVNAQGHDYGQWSIVKEASCTEEGEEIGVCSRCDSTESRKIAATGHSYEAVTTAPTCTEQGYTTYTCPCGESYVSDKVAALGHDYNAGSCTRCGEADPDYKPEPPTEKFKDVTEGAWYKEAVDYAVANELMNGTGNNKFEPESPMTRAMLVTVLWRYAGEPAEGTNSFADVEDSQWYTKAVAWAAHNGIVGGVGNGKFDPDGKITREQMAAILYRYCNSVGIDTSKREALNGFPDGGKTSSYAVDAISWAFAEGLITGSKVSGKVYLDPQGNATRAQVATILMRFIENVVE